MPTVRQRDLPQDPQAQEIVKCLAALTYNLRQDDIYADFLRLTEIYLRRLPINTLHVVQHGKPPEDDGEDTATWRSITKRYSAKQLDVFRQAMYMLIEMCDPTRNTHSGDYKDLLGDIYMNWGFPSSAMGQYFTPYPIAKLMAQVMIGDGEKECRQRIAQAIDASIYHEVWGASGASITQPGKEQMMLNLLPMVYKHLDPITINEPCIGSGVMMLAAAATYPRWAVDYCVVQFSGSDIDGDCVLMSKINFMLYGLNGYYLKLTAAAMGFAPDGTLVQRKVNFAQERPTKTVEPTPPLPAPMEDTLPIAATPFVDAKPTKYTIQLPAATASGIYGGTQLTIFDALAELEKPQRNGKKQR